MNHSTELPLRKRESNSNKIEGLNFDTTSSLNKYFLCECRRKFNNKNNLKEHISSCSGVEIKLFCKWCNLSFVNRGNLTQHAKTHGDTSYQKVPKKFKCDVCDKKYKGMWMLKQHIRGVHYNLVASTTRFETEQINQVWVEKVHNSQNLVEMKKTGPNTLVIKGITDTNIKVEEPPPVKIDLHSIYPSTYGAKSNCKICKKVFLARDLKKHTQEVHFEGFVKHKCNNCGMNFKRSYAFLKHVCNRPDGRCKRKTNEGFLKDGLASTEVSSLKPILLE